jgi:hypothetical protein
LQSCATSGEKCSARVYSQFDKKQATDRPRAPGFPGASIGIDYKHVFFGNYNVALGTIPTRQVNARLSPDMDLVTVRLAMPIG